MKILKNSYCLIIITLLITQMNLLLADTDHGGADVTISSDTTWSGIHSNIDDMTIENNATLFSTQGEKLEIQCNNLTINSGSKISLDGKGYEPEEGPGAGNERRCHVTA